MQTGNSVHLLPHGLDPEPEAIAPADWKRLQSVQDRLQERQTLPTADIAFASHLLHSKPPLDTSRIEEDRQRMVLAQLCGTRPKKLTPDQRKRLFDTALPYTDSPNPVVRVNAMLVLASSRDLRAVAVLERYTQTDPDALNRKIAGDFLRRLETVLKSPTPHGK